MLLGCPWLQNTKVTHDWGNNFITIKGNGTVHTIAVIKHLESNTKCLEVLLYYDFVNGVTNEEEYMLLVVKLDLFIINTITLLELEILATMIVDAKISTDVEIDTNPKIGANTKIDTDMKINIDEAIFDFPHTLGEIMVDITLAQIKMQDMKMAKWNLLEEVQIRPLNLGTHDDLQVVKLNIDLDLFVTNVAKKYLKEYKVVFAWMYKDLRDIPPHLT